MEFSCGESVWEGVLFEKTKLKNSEGKGTVALNLSK